jgi:Tfp pilus assembly protein PilO
MGNLKSHVRWFIRAQWFMGALMVALLAAFYALGYRPQLARLRQLQQEIAQSQYELRQSEDRTRSLPTVAADVKQLRQQLSESRQLPPQQELPQFLKDIAGIGQDCSLHAFSFKQGMPAHGDLYCELPITLSFDGDFVDAFNFLRRAETMPRLVRVRELNIRAKDSASGRVDVQLSMNVYASAD